MEIESKTRIVEALEKTVEELQCAN